jgi:uncharacterized protein YegP (UPF0339 family)
MPVVDAHFLIDREQPDRFRFRFITANRTLVFAGGPYADTGSVHAAIVAVRARMLTPDWVRLHFLAPTSSYFFTIHCQGGNLLATSVAYSSPLAREAAIQSVQRNAPMAPVRREYYGARW